MKIADANLIKIFNHTKKRPIFSPEILDSSLRIVGAPGLRVCVYRGQRCRRCTCSRSVIMQENEPSIQRCIVIMRNLHSSDRLISRQTYTIQWLWLFTLHCFPASHLIILPRTSPHTWPTLRPTCRVGAWPQLCST